MGTEEKTEPQTTQEVNTTKSVTGTTVLSFTKPTPVWATWIFRGEFIINKCLMMYLSGTTHTVVDLKNDILILTIIDFGVWMLAKSIGVKKADLGLEDTGT
jgi:hypothetical protein